MEKNYINYPIIILFLVIVILSAVSEINYEPEIFGHQLRKFDLYSDLRTEESQSFLKIPGEAFSGSVLSYDRLLAELRNVTGFGQEKSMFFESGTSTLSGVVAKLNNAASGKVRIGYYGDSIIEGDYITGDLRNLLQKEFGGKGAGFLPVTAQDTRFKLTMDHKFSDNWTTETLPDYEKGKQLYGIGGKVYIPSAGSTVSYSFYDSHKLNQGFTKITIFYTEAQASQVEVKLNKSKTIKADLSPGKGIRKTEIDAGSNCKDVEIKFPKAGQARIFGIYAENQEGVSVDGFPIRSGTGISLSNFTVENLKQWNEVLPYDLFILQFGVNFLTTGKMSLSDYEKAMGNAIENIKSAFPDASVIVVSVGDKSKRSGGNFATDPMVPRLIETQKKLASAKNVAFWNLFEAMGGKNSMVKWSKADPPLSHSDYTHFTNKGGEKIAKMFFDDIKNLKNKK